MRWALEPLDFERPAISEETNKNQDRKRSHGRSEEDGKVIEDINVKRLSTVNTTLLTGIGMSTCVKCEILAISN
jgi:hypothetical protein